jgi:hypothetical protein
MKYKFEKVLDGIADFINKEIYSGMNDWQELVARITVGRFLSNNQSVKESLMNNGYIRTFGLIDSEGMVDVDTLIADIKKVITEKGKLTVDIPMFGKMTFKPEDADKLKEHITKNRYE